MSVTTQVAGGGGAIAGQWLGRIIGGLVGTVIGPEGTVIGGWIGGRVGAVAGRAAASAIASYMEGANEDVETKTKDAEQAKPCVDCGDIDCFKPPKGATAKDIEELKRQLDEQQDAINEIPPDDLLHNMESYEEIGRGTADAMSRATARDQWLSDTIDALTEGGMTKSDAKTEAAKRLKTMDVIHTPDLSAGGTGKLSESNGGLASRSINRSIGSQWSKRGAGSDKTRLEQLKSHAQNAREKGKANNVKLKVCDDNNADNSGGDQVESGTKGLGNSHETDVSS